MLKSRILTALVLALALLAVLFWLPEHWSVLAFGVTFTVGAWEWAGFGALHGTAARVGYAIVIALLLLFSWLWTRELENALILMAAACAWWIVAFLWLALNPMWRQPVLALFCGIPVLVPAFAALARLQVASHGFARGPDVVLWLLLLVFAADIGAFFAGRSLGRLKLAPRVSPGKTWEGAAGGLIMVMLVAWAGAVHFSLTVPFMLAFGCGVGVFSIVGDLTESMFKRAASLKDSSALLPGHGGLLDRLDSITAAAPLYALGLFGSGAIP
jgi:phosphatidate cytidylyltransferase